MKSKFRQMIDDIKAMPKTYKLLAVGLTALIIVAIVACSVIVGSGIGRKSEETTQDESVSDVVQSDPTGVDVPSEATTYATTAVTTRSTTTTTTQRQTTKKIKSMGSAYWDVVMDYEDTYGEFERTQPAVTGVCDILLYDYDVDGVDELTLVYNTNRNSIEDFKYDIFTYDGRDAVKICSKYLRCVTYDMMPNMSFYTDVDTEQIYIYDVDDFDADITYGTLWTKDGYDFNEVYSLNIYEGRYRLDGEFFDYDDFEENQFSVEYIDIGNDETEYQLATAKKIIGKMDR